VEERSLKMEVIIRNLETIDELEMVRKLESLIWSFEDSIPINQTVAAVKNGGFILGAFMHGQLIGFQYSFPGFNGEKVYLYSHSLGIHTDYRKFGIGEKLKLAQRDLALEKGYDLITWTYDPLETVNGHLNLHKLGANCSTYLVNAYGDMADGLNAGIPTVRFLVEWWINDHIVKEKYMEGAPIVIQTSIKEGYLHPLEIKTSLNNRFVYVPVPGNFQDLKKGNEMLALTWRNITREVFTFYFQQGWLAIDLVKDKDNVGQYLYLLEKRNGVEGS
jgi:predicted GNAT superfamily acetyltransferase